jgi:hypothetical protein
VVCIFNSGSGDIFVQPTRVLQKHSCQVVRIPSHTTEVSLRLGIIHNSSVLVEVDPKLHFFELLDRPEFTVKIESSTKVKIETEQDLVCSVDNTLSHYELKYDSEV